MIQSAMLAVELQLEALFQPALNNSRFPWKRRIDLRKKANFRFWIKTDRLPAVTASLKIELYQNVA